MKASHIITGISICLNVALAGFLWQAYHSPAFDVQGENTYKYLSKRIFISDQNDLLVNFVPLRKKLSQYMEPLKHTASLYFEYLPTGNSIGIREKEEFIPASLLKMPLAMGAFKKIEDGKIDPNEDIVLSDQDIDPRFGNLWKKGTGYTLPFHEALEILIKDSDNTAQHVIFRNLSGNEIDDVFDSLDIPKERDASNSAVVTTKNYSSILRCLYLSCYMSEKSSNAMLDLLAHTNYDDKLPSGLPKNVIAAHKIGVVESENQNESIFSDCGIVYEQKRPYILCMMARTDEKTARGIMRDISKMIYDYMHTTNP